MVMPRHNAEPRNMAPSLEVDQTESRRRMILDYLHAHRAVRTSRLSKEFGVSEVSIRKDFEVLERRGLIQRVHGGAQMTDSGLSWMNLSERYTVNRAAKEKIALEAVRRLNRPNLQIYIDTGTTNALLARAIPNDLAVTVVTNSLGTIAALAGRRLCKVITLGGVVDFENRIFIGPWDHSLLERLSFDFVFVGADSVSEEGFGANDYEYSEMLHRIVRRAGAAYVLADSSKAGTRAAHLYAHVEDVAAWITDEGVSHSLAARFADKGDKLIIVR